MANVYGERIAALEKSVESIHKRLDYQGRILENVQDMALAIKGILGEMQHMRDDVDAIKLDVEIQKAKPGKRLDTLTEQVIALLCAAVIGGFLSRVFM